MRLEPFEGTERFPEDLASADDVPSEETRRCEATIERRVT